MAKGSLEEDKIIAAAPLTEQMSVLLANVVQYFDLVQVNQSYWFSIDANMLFAFDIDWYFHQKYCQWSVVDLSFYEILIDDIDIDMDDIDIDGFDNVVGVFTVQHSKFSVKVPT